MSQEGNVEFCPITKESWEARAEAKKADCGGQSEYHCLADNMSRTWERCVEKTRIQAGYCPIFRDDGFINWKHCNTSAPTCPNSSYLSNEVYRYAYCFGNNGQHGQKMYDLNDAEGVGVGSVIGIVVAILFVLCLAFVIRYIWKQRSSTKTKDHHELENLLEESEGTVKEKKSTGISLLLRADVKSVFVQGKIGSGVSSTSYSISEGLKKLKTNWEILDCRYTELPNTVSEKTILFVHGWFGIWNDDLCSVGNAKEACRSLIRILGETKKVKLLIGMRSDLYMKYHEELNADDKQKQFKLFEHDINLDSADPKEDAEYEKYFYENIIQKCQTSVCAFRNQTCKMIQTDKDVAVGMPLKLSLIEHFHDLIHGYTGEWDICMVMVDHFRSLENEERKRHVYAWIVYICLKSQFTRAEQFDGELVNKIGIQIDKSSFNEKDKDLQRYFRVQNSKTKDSVSPNNAQYVFWHRFLYICAFKSLFPKKSELVIKYCNVEAILQLVRPEGVKTSYLEVTANEHYVSMFNERLQELDLAEKYRNHPLVRSRTGDTERELQEIS